MNQIKKFKELDIYFQSRLEIWVGISEEQEKRW